MRCLLKNKVPLWYALYTTSTDVKTGKKIIIDGKQVDVEYGTTKTSYSTPVGFKGNISYTGGDVYETEYGIDKSKYSASLVVDKGLIPIDEHSIIWINEPDDDPSTADFKVVKVIPSLNVDRYLLQRIEK